MTKDCGYYRPCPRCRARCFHSEAHYTEHTLLCDEEPSERQERKRELRIEQHIERSRGRGLLILGGGEGLLARVAGGGQGPRDGEEFLGRQGAVGGEQFLGGRALGPTGGEQFLGRGAGSAGEHGRRRTPITLGDFLTGDILDRGGRGRAGGDLEGFDSVDPRPRSTVEKRRGGFSSASPVRGGTILEKSPTAVPHAGGVGPFLEEDDGRVVVKKSPAAVLHAGGVVVKKSPAAVPQQTSPRAAPHSVEDSDAGRFLEGPLALDGGICGRGPARDGALGRGGRGGGRASFAEVIRRNARGHGRGSS